MGRPIKKYKTATEFRQAAFSISNCHEISVSFQQNHGTEGRERVNAALVGNSLQVQEASQKKEKDCFNVNPAIQEVDDMDQSRARQVASL